MRDALRRWWPNLGEAAVVVALLTAAETALLHAATGIIAGSIADAPLDWGTLWLLGLLAYAVPHALSVVPGPARAGLLTLAIVATALASLYLAAYPHRAPLDPRWMGDAAFSLVFGGYDARRSVGLTVAAVGILWWRQLAREAHGVGAAEWVFRWGPLPVGLVLAGALGRWGARSPEIGAVASRVVAFFVFVLLALAYARWIEAPASGEGARSALPRWILAIMAPLLLAEVVAAVVSLALFGRIDPAQGILLGLLGNLILFVLWGFSAVVTGIAAAVSAVFRWLLSLTGARLEPGAPAPPRASGMRPRAGRVNEEFFQTFPNVVLVLTALGLCIIGIWALARYRARREGTGGAAVTREPIAERPDLAAGLRRLLRGFRRAGEDPLHALGRDPRWRHTAEVRRAYRDAQGVYARAGRARTPSQTAGEHAGAQGSPPLTELTALYDDARYSTVPAPEPRARRARELEERIEAERGAASPHPPQG